MIFSNKHDKTDPVKSIETVKGIQIEMVTNYKYLRFLLDQELSFRDHIANLVRKQRVKLGFYYRNRSCFSLGARKYLVSATLMSLIDYGDVLYMSASTKCL